MFNRGLSLEQAPPIGVILRFFLTVPFSGMLLSLLMLYAGSDLLVPHSPPAVAAVHMLFIGVITMAMVGALFQMLPVLAGVVIEVPSRRASLIHLLLTLGTISLGWAFVGFAPVAYASAGLLLGAAFAYLILLTLPALLRQRGGTSTLRGMQTALLSLTAAVAFAVVMLYGYGRGELGGLHEALRASHYTFALIGWVGFLIISVAFQVVEMFYVTPPYPDFCQVWGWRIFLGAMVLKSIWLLAGLPFSIVFDAVIALELLGFAAVTLKRLSQRKRPISDVTVWFWRFGAGMLSLATLLWLLHELTHVAALLPAMLIAYAAFAMSIIFGMMYKIVPFLIWFHLNTQGYFDAPVMSEIIPSKRAKWFFRLFALAVLMLFGGFASVLFVRLSAVVLLAAFLLLGYNLASAVAMYRRTRMSISPMSAMV